MSGFESVVEEAAIEYLRDLGYEYVHGLEIAPDGPDPERAAYSDVILAGRLHAALARINPHLDPDALERVANQVLRPVSPSLEENNLTFQQWLTRGIDVQLRKDGQTRGDLAWLFDFENPENNDWLVTNQFTVISGKNQRRPDLIVFVNGMPIAVIELKNPLTESATVKSAWNQLQTYKSQIPDLFNTNQLLVISDGTSEARVGSLTAGYERFGPWRTVDGSGLAPEGTPPLEVLIRGLFEKRRLLDYIRHFVLWETDGGLVKKIAGYHQYHAANKAVDETVRASSSAGDKRIGVVWHTQGSGKSISMAFYTGKLILAPAMENPTVVVITDRNDLDGQLFGQFAAAKDLLPSPKQAESRDHLKKLLNVASGGIVFSTIQKFSVPTGERFPELSDRRNIVVIADEAHRSQYEFIEGFARNLRDGLPNASFIGFTGTPIEFDDRSTPAVFGNYIDTYTISQSVEDKATVPLYYEARLAKIDLPDERKPEVDEEFEEITEGEEESDKRRLKTRWTKLEAMVGTEERLALIARDILDHFDRRTEILEGKAMVVAMSRRIAADLYEEIVKLRPEWDSDTDEDGGLKVVMTGSASDPPEWQKHVRNKPRMKDIEKRFKDPDDSLRMVIVRDMWLTGFDAPCAHTLYVDKPMKGHGLMQAIARVNRVFKDKPSGLVVDYLGLADQLRKAVGGFGGNRPEPPGLPVEIALKVLEEKFGIVKDMFHGFDYSGAFSTTASDQLTALQGGLNHICGRAVAPLDEAQRDRIGTIFSKWEHPLVKGKAEQAAALGDGTPRAAQEVLELLEKFLVADVGSDNELLYEHSVGALHRLLARPSVTKLERISATKELVLQLEPFMFKMLEVVSPKTIENWAKKGKTKGLGAAMGELRKAGGNPNPAKSTDEFVNRIGGDDWPSFEHAMVDVMGGRLDSAHRSIETEPYLWRSAMCVMLRLVEHNREDIAALPDAPFPQADRRSRFLNAMAQLNKGAGIAIHLEGARDMRDEIGYFQKVQKNLKKYSTGGSGKSSEELNAAIRQIVSEAVSSDEVVDIFGTAGLKKPDISILSDEFLESVKASPHQNLQLEVLKKLLNDEITATSKTNIIQSKRFSEMMEQTLLAYQNRTIEAAQVIMELIELARELRESPKRGDELGLSEDELAFYDALAAHGDAGEVMDDGVLAEIAQDLVETIRRSVTIDWTQKEAVRADMRRKVKRLLRRHGYPPDKREEAVLTVIEQAEHVCRDWSRAA